jgi:hypothetical protein
MSPQSPKQSTGGRAHSNFVYATMPTRWTVFLRTFFPWQVWRFVWINFKMLGIIRRSHQGD